jgi:hypothetical protein
MPTLKRNGETMPLTLAMNDFVTSEPKDLGTSDWIVLGPERARLLQQLSEIAPAPAPIAGNQEIDPFIVLAMLPALLATVFQFRDASAHRLVALEQCNFLSSIPVNAEIRMTARILDGQFNADGYLVYRLGFLVNTKTASRPVMVGEMAGMAGNPAEHPL